MKFDTGEEPLDADGKTLSARQVVVIGNIALDRAKVVLVDDWRCVAPG